MEEYSNKIIVDFEPISRRVIIPLDKSLYETLIKINIQIRSLCGGKGTCGKCKLLIQKGIQYLDPPTEADIKLLNEDELKEGWRLACQSRINKELIQKIKLNKPPQFRIYIPDELLLEDFNILTSGINKNIQICPAVKKLFLEVKEPSLKEPIPDFERLRNSLISEYKEFDKEKLIDIDYELLKILPSLLRENENRITIAIWNENKVIACEPGNTYKDNFGIAFDIGTTTLVGYLINLNNGKIYSIASELNPQTAYGEDVVTRITYTRDNEEGLQKLNSIVLYALNNIIKKNCAKANINPSQIYEATVVGNSVMHHIFLGISPVNIGISPYVPIIQQALNIKANKLGLNISKQGNVYVLPTIAGFVGADTMGVILASNINEEHDLSLAIDIGTNGEIIIGNNKSLATGSCAAGSALEGAHIKDGMRAAAGSIDSIKIDPNNLEVSYTTIKNKKPIGICGSGLIDAVAEMLKANILARSGNFNKELVNHERFYKNGNGTEFIIAKKNETNLGKDITISQADIRQIQMAKAAFFSGAIIILKYLKNNLNSEQIIKQIFLAGAFGNYIDKENARFIGMIPDIPSDKIYQIGNAAGVGAQNCLLNTDFRKKAQELLKNVQYVEIATKKEFQREFAEAMYFPHLNLDLFPSLYEYKNLKLR